MKEHYLTTQHQNVVQKCIHQMKSRTTTDDTTKTEASKQQGKGKQIEEQSSTMKLSAEESQSFLPGFKYNQDVLQQEVMSLKESVDDMKYVSYDGIFIWKISNFKEKMSKI